ncbi:MFS transporter, partial [Phytoactinopolyspora endophytica]|uniref:MFS transporter n=1 Tax=Phytoactinopolyspora endophytica TaxID=1642495 RepID=UPI0013EBF716
MTTLVRTEPLPRVRIERPVAVTAVLIAAVLLVVSHIYLTIPLVPHVADDYGTSLTAAAWIGSGFGFAFAVGNLVFPTLSDHVDPRAVMAFGLAAVAVTGVLAGLAPNLPTLVAARAVQGFVAPALPAVALAYLPRVVPDRIRPTAIAVLSSCFLLAGIVGQAWALSVQPLLGWRWVLWGMAPLLLVVALLVVRLPETARPDVPGSFAGVIGTLAGMVRRPQILIAYTAALTILLTFVGMYVALQDSSAELGASGPVTSLLLRLPGLPGIALGWFAGTFIGRFGPHRTGAAAFLLAATGLGTEALGGPLWLTLVGSGVFVAGLAV